MMPRPEVDFTATHHALLFACVSKAVMQEVGEPQGEPVIREAVRLYGHQRGGRMALRALKNNHSLTVENYFAYGEWAVPRGQMKFALVERCPDARLNVSACPWYDIWHREKLLDYGRYFCMEIDAALVRGFNPDLDFETRQTRSTGGHCCDFVFKGADLNLRKMMGLVYRKKIRPGRKAVMPWAYHAGHLFKVMGETLAEGLPADAEKILQAATQNFARYFSRDHVAALKAYQDVDFTVLPG